MARRPQIANLYEDFHPVSEWKEEPENNILLVHLPDFAKEQIHITCVRTSRIVRVTGERQLTDNKWSRCNQAFPIPKNCKVDKIHAKWHDGTLTITLPKETITTHPQPQPQPLKVEAKTTQLEAPKAAANEPKSSYDYQKAAEPQPKYPKDQQTLPTTSINEREKKADHRKSFGALTDQKFEKEPLLQKGTDHQRRQYEETAFPKAAASSTEINIDMKQTNKKSEVPKAENIDLMTKKELKVAGDEKKDAIVEKPNKEKKSISAAAMIKAVKEMAMENNEDKQLMINMGVAVLVIVALGAYVSYSIGSKSKD